MYSIYRLNTPPPERPSVEEVVPVLKFCKANNIESEYDYNFRIARSWTEISFNGEMVMQIGANASVEQFLEVVRNMYHTIVSEKFKNLDVAVASVDGPDFDVCFEDYEENEELFVKFVEHYKDVFLKPE